MRVGMELAPATESYLPEPVFEFSPRQREVDFAQLLAAGGDLVESLIKASIVPQNEVQKLTRPQLYKMAANLLKSPAIQERIDHFRTLHQASMDTSADRIKQELASVAFLDPALTQHDAPIIDIETGEETTQVANVRDMRTLPRYVRAAIKEFYIDRDGLPRYKFHDKMKSLQMLADLEGMFKEADQAKAPQISFHLGGETTELTSANTPQAQSPQPVIDITPPAMPSFLL